MDSASLSVRTGRYTHLDLAEPDSTNASTALSLYACSPREPAKPSTSVRIYPHGEAEYSEIHTSASTRTVDFATTCMVLMYILAKSTVVRKRKKGAFDLRDASLFYTASLLKKATFRTQSEAHAW
ncbi:hypothetical protein EDD15DRAFT_2195847 [Pisolithus albus]|nr:hypothetical protein EDD15DRAFT_2195847 [Pisolithus albus]